MNIVTVQRPITQLIPHSLPITGVLNIGPIDIEDHVIKSVSTSRTTLGLCQHGRRAIVFHTYQIQI